MSDQVEKAEKFKSLHKSGTFIIPNPWDSGSARLLEGLGFQALTTISAGFAQALGKLDGQVSLEEKLSHCRSITDATDIPLSADFENGFADEPEQAAENVFLIT